MMIPVFDDFLTKSVIPARIHQATHKNGVKWRNLSFVVLIQHEQTLFSCRSRRGFDNFYDVC